MLPGLPPITFADLAASWFVPVVPLIVGAAVLLVVLRLLRGTGRAPKTRSGTH